MITILAETYPAFFSPVSVRIQGPEGESFDEFWKNKHCHRKGPRCLHFHLFSPNRGHAYHESIQNEGRSANFDLDLNKEMVLYGLDVPDFPSQDKFQPLQVEERFKQARAMIAKPFGAIRSSISRYVFR